MMTLVQYHTDLFGAITVVSDIVPEKKFTQKKDADKYINDFLFTYAKGRIRHLHYEVKAILRKQAKQEKILLSLFRLLQNFDLSRINRPDYLNFCETLETISIYRNYIAQYTDLYTTIDFLHKYYHEFIQEEYKAFLDAAR